MSDKKQVLLSFVGNRDPYDESKRPVTVGKSSFTERLSCLFSGCSCRVEQVSGEKSEGSILTLCRAISPDIIYLFPSSEGKSVTLHNAERVKHELASILPDAQCSILPLKGEDPTDFETLSREFREKLGRAASELGDFKNFAFHINCSSGTQQMAALAYVFANSGMFPGVQRWQCRDPKFPGDRVRKIDTLFLEEHTFVEKIKRNIDAYAFATIADDCALLADKSTTPRRREIALFLLEVFKAYSYQDTLRYQSACAKMKDAVKKNNALLDKETGKMLAMQTSLLDELKKGDVDETPENLIDLYFNMRRCFERGAYADVLSRFWRVGEGLVYYRLRSKWGIYPRNVDGSPDTENLKRLRKHKDFANTARQNEHAQFDRGRTALLEVFKDEEYIALWARYTKNPGKVWSENEIKNLIKKRNDTIVAHGMKAVTEEQAQDCVEITEAMMLALVPDAERRINDFPFKKEELQRLVLLLEKP